MKVLFYTDRRTNFNLESNGEKGLAGNKEYKKWGCESERETASFMNETFGRKCTVVTSITQSIC